MRDETCTRKLFEKQRNHTRNSNGVKNRIQDASKGKVSELAFCRRNYASLKSDGKSEQHLSPHFVGNGLMSVGWRRWRPRILKPPCVMRQCDLATLWLTDWLTDWTEIPQVRPPRRSVLLPCEDSRASFRWHFISRVWLTCDGSVRNASRAPMTRQWLLSNSIDECWRWYSWPQSVLRVHVIQDISNSYESWKMCGEKKIWFSSTNS